MGCGIHSMTGFGQAQRESAIGQISVEIRTVNNRFQDLSVALPRELAGSEMATRALLKSAVSRGRIDCRVRFSPATASQPAVTLNIDLIKAYLEQLKPLESLGVTRELSAQALLALPGVLQTDSAGLDESSAWDLLKATVEDAIAALNRERAREGEQLAAALGGDVEALDGLRLEIEAHKDDVVQRYRQKLGDRIAELEGETRGKLEAGRLEIEVALYADRCDITEETVRLAAHLDRFRALLTGDKQEPTGKSLEFLLQEIGREINTICSKARDTVVINHALEMKNIVERIREQAANVQ